MNIQKEIKFLKAVAANNNRPWFQEHKSEYNSCKDDFQQTVSEIISKFTVFDPEIAGQQANDCCYRFYRDIRFSADKSPYKRHFGAYISAHGKKALRGGYYLHIQPGHCLFAIGCYWLPTNILTSTRNEIMTRIDEWRNDVENKKFVDTFGLPNEGYWNDDEISPKGFGLTALKTCPKGFPKDYEYLKYLKMKDYCCWVRLQESFFKSSDFVDRLADIAKTAKPMMDFVNSVVDDYE